MVMDIRQDATPIEEFRKKKQKKDKLLNDLRVFTEDDGSILGWEAPTFKVGYTFPRGVTIANEDEARQWFRERIADGSFDWLLEPERSTRGEGLPGSRTIKKRRLVNPVKFKTDRSIEVAIQEKLKDIEELEKRREEAIAAGKPDKFSGVIKRAQLYLSELQQIRDKLKENVAW